MYLVKFIGDDASHEEVKKDDNVKHIGESEATERLNEIFSETKSPRFWNNSFYSGNETKNNMKKSLKKEDENRKQSNQ